MRLPLRKKHRAMTQLFSKECSLMNMYQVEICVRNLGAGTEGGSPSPELGFIPGVMPDPIKRLVAMPSMSSTHPPTEEGAARVLQDFFDANASPGAEEWGVELLGLHLIDRLTGEWHSVPGGAWTFRLLRNGDIFESETFLSGRRSRVDYAISLWTAAS